MKKYLVMWARGDETWLTVYSDQLKYGGRRGRRRGVGAIEEVVGTGGRLGDGAVHLGGQAVAGRGHALRVLGWADQQPEERVLREAGVLLRLALRHGQRLGGRARVLVRALRALGARLGIDAGGAATEDGGADEEEGDDCGLGHDRLLLQGSRQRSARASTPTIFAVFWLQNRLR